MSDWTPGPWVVEDKGHRIHGISFFWLVPDLVSMGTRNRADAVLAAAAPDLYEALSRMVKIYDGMEDSMGDPCPAVEHSKIILAKARGEA